MKVQQLKAELVVFKGLMSNVSAATTPPARFPRGSSSQRAACKQAEQAFLAVACRFPFCCPSPHFALLPFFSPCHPLIQEKKKERRSRGVVWDRQRGGASAVR